MTGVQTCALPIFRRESPWQNQQVSSTPVNGRRSQPINPKTLRPCQSLHLRGRWHFAKRNDGRGSFRDEPSQSRCARQLSRRASPWQNQQVSSTPVNGRKKPAVKQQTFRLCQSLHLRGRWHGEAVTERVSQSELSAGSAERPAYSVIFRRCKKQEHRTSCFYEYCTGAGSLFLSIA